MKVYRYLSVLLLLSALVSSCTGSYDRPPLTEPEYTKAEPNITIAKLKSRYADIVDPTLIDVDYVIRGTVIGNDISGNIYKQIFIQDETAGISIGIDQSSIYTQYRVGQEVIIHVKGLSMVKYGDQLQIGYDKTNANRIPWEVFQLQAHKNKWPKVSNATPTTITLDQVSESMVHTLVKLENVYFEKGGEETFSESDATTNRILKDGAGRSIIVRNSNFAAFAADRLPEGAGTVIAVLSKFRNDWQLNLRSIEDIQDFGRPIPGKEDTPLPPGATVYFSETFGTGDVSSRPLISAYTGFDTKTVKYSDPTGVVSVRTTKTFATPHLWFPSGKTASLIIEGIDTSAAAGKKISLTYELVANLYNAGAKMNLNAMTVEVDGKPVAVPSKEVSKDGGDDNKVYVASIPNIPAKKGLTIKFITSAEQNLHGLRLDNISIVDTTDDAIVVTPKN